MDDAIWLVEDEVRCSCRANEKWGMGLVIGGMSGWPSKRTCRMSLFRGVWGEDCTMYYKPPEGCHSVRQIEPTK